MHPLKKFNKYCNLSNGSTIVELTQGQWTILDTEDWEKVKNIKWFSNYHPRINNFYVYSKIPIGGSKRKTIILHRIILNIENPQIPIDHKNHDTLDNRKNNLRIDYEKKNSQNYTKPIKNKSGFKGVQWREKSKKWEVSIKVNNKYIYIGQFVNLIEAAKEYDFAAKKYHGEWAYLNFPS